MSYLPFVCFSTNIMNVKWMRSSSFNLKNRIIFDTNSFFKNILKNGVIELTSERSSAIIFSLDSSSCLMYFASCLSLSHQKKSNYSYVRYIIIHKLKNQSYSFLTFPIYSSFSLILFSKSSFSLLPPPPLPFSLPFPPAYILWYTTFV